MRTCLQDACGKFCCLPSPLALLIGRRQNTWKNTWKERVGQSSENYPSHYRGRHSSQGIINLAMTFPGANRRQEQSSEPDPLGWADILVQSPRQGIAVEVFGTDKEAQNGGFPMSSFWPAYSLSRVSVRSKACRQYTYKT